MVDPGELVAVARLLASDAASSDAALRRSVSTAYYALFHALAAFAAERLVGDDTSAASVLVYRGLDHKKIKDALEDVAKPTMRLVMRRAIGKATISAELKTFADVFVPMQQLRHLADYHPLRDFSRSDVLDMIDEVDDALLVLASVPRAELTNLMTFSLVGSRIS